MKIFLIILTIASFVAFSTYSQSYVPDIKLEAGAQASFGKNSPFWLSADQYGAYSFNPSQTYMRAAAIKELKDSIGFYYGIDAYNRFDGKNYFHLQQCYGGFKYRALTAYVGLKEDFFGNHNPELSCGGTLWSKNAPPMPSIYAGIPEYATIPYTFNLLEIKGGMVHGWFGEKDQFVKNAYLHHKYGSLRLKITNSLKINAGLHHAAMWGGVSPADGNLGSGLKQFFWAFAAKSAEDSTNFNPGELINKYGNHLASYQCGIDYSFSNFDLNFYWQTFLEDKNGRVGVDWQNKTDGLWGLVYNSKHSEGIFQTILLEYIHTSNQSGDLSKSGGDDYYNNYVYRSGWSYLRYTMGTPLISSPLYEIDGVTLGTVNNSLIAYHLAAAFNIQNNKLNFKTTYSHNYGLVYLLFNNPRNQFSTYFEYVYSLDSKMKNLYLSCECGIDYGKLYGNNYGIRLKLIKTL